jgi:hypothetical protein
VNGTCVFSPSNTAAPSDAGCKSWDWNNQVCLECSKGSTFNSARICVTVSDQCKTNDVAGLCTSCYKGYDLFNESCVLSTFNNAKPSDAGCASWDWDNQVCLTCSIRWAFNANHKCTPVDDYCSSYDKTSGACTSCFGGYNLANGSCQLGNPLCRTSTSAGACSACYTGYVLTKGSCTPISQLASLYLYYAECCPEKLAALQAGTAVP